MTTTSKKLVPNKRFPEFENSGEWEEKKLEDIVDILDNLRRPISKNNRIPGQYPYYGANGIMDYINDYIFDGTYLLIGEDGSVINQDSSPVMHIAIGKFWVNNHAHVVKEKCQLYNLYFIYYALHNVNIEGLVKGIPPKLNQENLKTIRVIISDIKEQQKIADFLSSVDELIELEQKKLEELQEYKQGLLQNLFPKENQKVPDLRFPEFENSGEWEENKLDILFDFKNGYTPSKNNIAYWENGTIPWFRMEDIRVNGNILHDSIQHITEIAVKNNKLFPANSIILSISATIGEFALIKCDFICNQRFVCLSLKNNSCDIMYCYYYMNNISKWCKNNVHNNTFAAINIDKLKKISILFPSLEEQQKIADFLSSVDELIIEQTTKLKLLCDYKKGLLQQLFPN